MQQADEPGSAAESVPHAPISDARYRALLESAPDAMVIVDRAGTIALVNSQVERMFGYTRDEILGKPVEMLLPERFRDAHDAHRRGFAQDPRVRRMGAGLELSARRKDGTEFPVEISLSPLETEDGRVVTAAIRDTSDRKRAALEQARLAAIVTSSNDAILSKTPDGLVTSWNPAAERLLGHSAVDVLGRPVYELIVPPERLHEEMAVIARAASGEPVEQYETERLRKDGSRVEVTLTVSPLVDAGGRVVGVSSIMRDISERKRADARFRALLESAPDAMVIVDGQGRIVLVNTQTERMFGYGRGELLGEPVETLMPFRFRGAHVGHRSGFSTEPRLRPMGAGLELFGRRKDGTEFPVEISLSPLQTEEGVLVSSAIRDVTSRKEAEEKLKHSVREKEVLLQEIHHRVKNNLQVIASLLNLQARTVQDDGVRSILSESRNRVKSMALVHEILYRSNEFSRVGFGDYVRQLAHDLARAYGAGPGKVRVLVEASGPTIEVDRAVNLGLIVNELASNALKHAFPDGRGGEIRIRSESREGGAVDITVSDDGVGFPADVDIRSTQTLGMQVVVTLVEQLSGTIEVERNPGTTFRVRVPATGGGVA